MKAWLIVVILVVTSALVHQNMRIYNNLGEGQADLPDTATIKIVSAGYDNMVSSLMWVHLISYYGGELHRSYKYLSGLIDRITTLNPLAEHAYYVAATSIPWGTGSTELSDYIIDRAIVEMPDDWRWPYYRAFNAYWFNQDYKTAGRFMKMASERDAPPMILNLALRFSVNANEIEPAIIFIQQRLNEATDEDMYNDLYIKLLDLVTEREIRRIESELERRGMTTSIISLKALHKSGIKVSRKLPDGGFLKITEEGLLVSSKRNKRFSIINSNNFNKRHQ